MPQYEKCLKKGLSNKLNRIYNCICSIITYLLKIHAKIKGVTLNNETLKLIFRTIIFKQVF